MTTTIDSAAFYNAVRQPLFNGHMTQSQVDGLNYLLRLWLAQYNAWDMRWVAYCLATAHHETGAKMQPIEEVGHGAGYVYGEPDPVTGQTYYGRGFVQLTLKTNYEKMGAKIHVDLVHNPALALNMVYAGVILYGGMRDGDFTGKQLSGYFGGTVDDPVGARAIVNGDDDAEKIAGYHRSYLAALQAAVKPVAAPVAAAPVTPAPLDLSPLFAVLPTPAAYAAFYAVVQGMTKGKG